MRPKSRDLPGWIDWQIIKLGDWKTRLWASDLKDSPKKKKKKNETSEERAARVSRVAARKQARISSLSKEERILRQQQQREQTRLRVQALRRKRQQIVALQSSVEPDAVNAGNSEGDPSVHLQTPQLVVVAPPNQGTKISGNLVKFRKAILEAPSNKCFSCKKLHYGKLGEMIA